MLAAGAGVATAVALAAFYRGLATARVGVVAPVAAVLGAAIPVVVSIAASGLPAPAQLGGMAVGLLGVGLVSRAPDEGDRPLGLGIALLAGCGFGAFFVCLGSLEGDAVFWPLAVARVVAGASLFVAARVARRPALPPRETLPLVAIVSVLDMVGMAGYLFAVQIGRLDQAAVLSSLYPVVTIVLAAVVFHERVGAIQAFGIALAMLAIVLIGAG